MSGKLGPTGVTKSEILRVVSEVIPLIPERRMGESRILSGMKLT